MDDLREVYIQSAGLGRVAPLYAITTEGWLVVVTNMFDDEGRPVFDWRQAEQAVGFDPACMKWVSFSVPDARAFGTDLYRRVLH